MGGVVFGVDRVVSFWTSRTKSKGGFPNRSAGVLPPWHGAQYLASTVSPELAQVISCGGGSTASRLASSVPPSTAIPLVAPPPPPGTVDSSKGRRPPHAVVTSRRSIASILE